MKDEDTKKVFQSNTRTKVNFYYRKLGQVRVKKNARVNMTNLYNIAFILKMIERAEILNHY